MQAHIERHTPREHTHTHLKDTHTHTHMVLQGALHREGLVQEALVELLLRLVHHDDGHAMAVILRPPGAPHHLQEDDGTGSGKAVGEEVRESWCPCAE